MPRIDRIIILACLPLAALACARSAGSEQPAVQQPAVQPSRGIWAGYVGTSSSDSGISAVNQTERPVHYTAFEREMLTRVRWAPCTGGPGCRTLVPGGSTVLPWTEVSGYDPSKKEYVFYWWHAVKDEKGDLRPDSMRAVAITR
jgi:hypothetical protein